MCVLAFFTPPYGIEWSDARKKTSLNSNMACWLELCVYYVREGQESFFFHFFSWLSPTGRVTMRARARVCAYTCVFLLPATTKRRKSVPQLRAVCSMYASSFSCPQRLCSTTHTCARALAHTVSLFLLTQIVGRFPPFSVVLFPRVAGLIVLVVCRRPPSSPRTLSPASPHNPSHNHLFADWE